MDRKQVSTLVISCLQDVIGLKGKNPPNIEESMPLIGSQSVLDSLDLVTLTMELEEKLEESYSVSLTLANDCAMSQKNSPFQTVQSLTDYICMLVQKE